MPAMSIQSFVAVHIPPHWPATWSMVEFQFPSLSSALWLSRVLFESSKLLCHKCNFSEVQKSSPCCSCPPLTPDPLLRGGVLLKRWWIWNCLNDSLSGEQGFHSPVNPGLSSRSARLPFRNGLVLGAKMALRVSSTLWVVLLGSWSSAPVQKPLTPKPELSVDLLLAKLFLCYTGTTGAHGLYPLVPQRTTHTPEVVISQTVRTDKMTLLSLRPSPVSPRVLWGLLSVNGIQEQSLIFEGSKAAVVSIKIPFFPSDCN